MELRIFSNNDFDNNDSFKESFEYQNQWESFKDEHLGELNFNYINF